MATSEIHSAGASAHGLDQPVSLKRNITVLSIVGIGMSICQGWAAMGSTIVLGLSQGGTVTVLYGLIGVAIVNMFIALSLGELSSAYPSAGGQYVYTAALAGPKSRRALSFVVAWVTVFEWITIVASVVFIGADIVFGLVETFNPAFTIQRWQVFLVFMCFNLLSIGWNILLLQKTPHAGKVFFYLSSVSALIILIVTVSCAPTYQSNKFVWGTYTNEIGWSSGFLVVVSGLINPGYVYAGIDGAVHITEECHNPAKAIPLALISTVGMAFVTGFAMSVGLIYSVQDLEAAIDSELPFLTIIVQATNSRAAGAVLMMLFLTCIFYSMVSVHQATARLIWAFARDGGLPASPAFTKLDPRFNAPLLPLLVSFFGVTILGLLYVASTVAYGSIIECCILLGNVSYAIPCIQLLLRGRRLPDKRWLKLGVLGAVSNVITIIYCILTTVIWMFPSGPDPAPSSMNYSSAVLGAMAIIAMLDWIFFARITYQGPTEDAVLNSALAAEAEEFVEEAEPEKL